MAAFRAPARSPMGASRPRRTHPAGWPPREGNGNCLWELPAPSLPVPEAPAKRAGRAQKQEKQVIGKASFGGRSRGSPFPENAQSSAGKGCEVRVPGGDRLRGGCDTAQPHWDKLLLCHHLPGLITPHKEKSVIFSGSLGEGTHMTIALHPIDFRFSQHHKSSLWHTGNCHPPLLKFSS